MLEFKTFFRTERGIVEGCELRQCASAAMADLLRPIRIAPSFKGQRSLPGYFWMSRLNQMVMYESRLEMVILLQLDSNPSVANVTAQPFVLQTSSATEKFRHIPDFFVRYDNDMGEVINVKPKKFVGTARNQRAFSACAEASAEMGFGYSTRSEPEKVLAANIWWLSGYRREPPRFEEYVAFLLTCAENSLSIGEIVRKSEFPALIRPVLFYLLWKRILSVDLHSALTERSIVTLPKGNLNGQ